MRWKIHYIWERLKRKMNEIHNKLLDILLDIRPDVDFEHTEGLISDEVLDSFDMVAVVSEIGEKFAINVDVNDITFDNFDSLSAMENYIAKEKE